MKLKTHISVELNEDVRRLLSSFQGMRVLDHGCGDGRVSLFLSEYASELYIVDSVPSRVDETARLVRAFGRGKTLRGLFAGSVNDWNCDVQFDGIVSHRVLHLMGFQDRSLAYSFFKRHLNPGGRMFVSVKADEDSRIERMRHHHNWLDVGNGEFRRLTGDRYLKFFEASEICRELTDTRFKVTNLFPFSEKATSARDPDRDNFYFGVDCIPNGSAGCI